MNRLRITLAAPHRLAFLTGCVGLSASVGWWLVVLAGNAGAIAIMPQHAIPAALLHAPMLLFFGYSPFVFGFLMTVFPRWMGFPDLAAARYGPVSAMLAVASIAATAGLWTGGKALLIVGFGLLLAGWVSGIAVLAVVLRGNHAERKPICWHACSAIAAMILGLAGVMSILAFLVTGNGEAWQLGNRLAAGGFLLPTFLTVSHRMIPFFAGNVVTGYKVWKPDWLLATLWIALMVRLAGEIAGSTAFGLAGNGALAGITALMAWKWWPQGTAPGLLNVLIWGFAWAPAGFLFDALASADIPLGFAPIHALMLGFSGSMLVAMATRVTQGHSGRPLAMSTSAWIAFVAIQLATLARLFGALSGEGSILLAGAATLLFFGTAPWLLHNALVYLAPRTDGKAG